MEKEKRFIKEIKNREKNVDKKGFTKYFSYEPTTLVNNVLGQNTEDLRKSLDKIKQQKIKLNKDERNSTNNKNENDRLNMILSVIGRIYQFFEYKIFSGEQLDESKLPKQIKVSKQRFDVIKNKVQNAKSNDWKARPNRSKVINFNESNKLLHEIENSKITYEEALKRIENIRSDINKIISMQSLDPNQIKVLNILFMVNETFTSETKSLEVNNKGNLEVLKGKSDIERKESDG